MKILRFLMAGVIVMTSVAGMQAQSLQDILSGIGKSSSSSSTTGNIITGLIEGVFTKSNLTLADLTGDYKADGPAITFKSENFLQKAGGIAGASAIESKLNPYYEQYGLNSMTLTVDENANFTMKIKSLSLTGTITKNESEGTFEFNFKAIGINLGKFTAYIEKSGNNLNLMFDATKLKSFISTIVKITGNSMASAMGSILDSYDGMCLGWKMVSTGSNTTTNSSVSSSSSTPQVNSETISNGINALKGILGK